MSIRNALIHCLRRFKNVIEAVHEPAYCSGSKASTDQWSDELGRLRIWSADVGAHQAGQSSLDFGLRDASHVRQEVISLLADMRELLDEAKQDYLDALDSPTQDQQNDFRSLFGAFITIIQCLYKLAILIRNSPQHDLRSQSYTKEIDVFKPFDHQHVRAKFPQADEQLALRLGNAMTRRRGHLAYRQRHNHKLSQGLEEVEDGSDQRSDLLSETVVSNVLPQHIQFDNIDSNSDISQTSYASSLVKRGSITIPAPPKNTTFEEPLVCPYCYYLIQVRNTKAWHHHVFVDLQPYICTFERCRTPEKLYASRRVWFAHLSDNHDTNNLECPLCKETASSVKHFQHHLARHLEELALFTLPRGEDSDEIRCEENSTESSNESEHSNGVEYSDPHTHFEDSTVDDMETAVHAVSDYDNDTVDGGLAAKSDVIKVHVTPDEESRIRWYCRTTVMAKRNAKVGWLRNRIATMLDIDCDQFTMYRRGKELVDDTVSCHHEHIGNDSVVDCFASVEIKDRQRFGS
ncbi:MAG: hypothetical protein Q9222_003050 [Ikaeria aurantiellina]